MEKNQNKFGKKKEFYARNAYYGVQLMEKYQEEAKKFRMKLEYNLLASKFNSSSNPTFEAGNELMKDKLISEVGIIIGAYTDDLDVEKESQEIYIYGKISPPIRKNNTKNITLRFTLDW